jgi:ATP-binding protein involved in chromosome partitioning
LPPATSAGDSNADVVSLGPRGKLDSDGVAAQNREQSFHETPVRRAEHGVLEGGGPEGAVVADDGVRTARGMGGEPVRRQGVGHGLHGRANRTGGLAGCHLAPEGPAVLSPYVVGHPLGLDRIDERKQPRQEEDEQVVTMGTDDRLFVRAGAVVLRGPAHPGPGGIDEDLQVTPCSQLVEVVPGDVRVQGEVLCHLAHRHTLVLADEQVDAAPRGIPERRGDGLDRSRETLVIHYTRATVHTDIVPGQPARHLRGPSGTHTIGRKTHMAGTDGLASSGLAGAVAGVEDPRLFHTLGDLGLVRSISAEGRLTRVIVAVPRAGHPAQDELGARIAAAISATGAPPAEVAFVQMTDEEEIQLASRIQELGRGGRSAAEPLGVPGQPDGGLGSAGPVPRPNPFADRASPTRVLGIGSGKGGVGKSSVTVNLAVSLARAGHSVGVLDADVYGFSIPSMLGVREAPTMLGPLLVPPVVLGVRCMSMGFFVPDEQAVIWRGPMLHKALEQFLVDVHWGSPDFLLIDLPPGTGDVSLSIAQFVPRAELIVVTTPQPAAGRVAQRAAIMARQVRLPVRGVVENMSGFVGDDGTRYDLFGSGGGQQLANELGVGLLAQIPFVPALRTGGDTGVPITVSQPDSEVGTAFAALAARIAELGPSRVYRSELSVH